MDVWSKAQKLPFSKKILSKKVILSYIFDYAIIIILIIAFYAVDAVEPFHQHFATNNYTLWYPYAEHERVPIGLCFVITCLFPAAIIALYTLVIDGLFSHQQLTVPSGRRRQLTGRYRLKDRLWELNCGILGLLLSVGAAFVITGTLKNAIGKPRPDLIARCFPEDWKAKNVTVPVFGLANHDMCRQPDNAILKDGFRSFPSGHSSTAFAGLYYLSLYLAAKLHILDSKGEVWKSLIVLIPTLGAALIAGSRIMDARHHPFDVLSGSLLGILVAWGSYRQYFPPVSETWRKGRAYPIRSWGREPAPPPAAARLDEGVEPLRVPAWPADEEQRGAGYATASGPRLGPGSDAHNGNVFRQQVSASQRRRLQEQETGVGGAYHAPPSSTYSADPSAAAAAAQPRRDPSTTSYTSQLPSANPFAAAATAAAMAAISSSGPQQQQQRPRYHNNDGYWESSSEDGENDDLELQPRYTLSDPQGEGPYGGVYDHAGSVRAVGGEDTAYHSQSQVPRRLESVRVPSAVMEGGEEEGRGQVGRGPVHGGG